jgi:hypothetical protein
MLFDRISSDGAEAVVGSVGLAIVFDFDGAPVKIYADRSVGSSACLDSSDI